MFFCFPAFRTYSSQANFRGHVARSCTSSLSWYVALGVKFLSIYSAFRHFVRLRSGRPRVICHMRWFFLLLSVDLHRFPLHVPELPPHGWHCSRLGGLVLALLVHEFAFTLLLRKRILIDACCCHHRVRQCFCPCPLRPFGAPFAPPSATAPAHSHDRRGPNAPRPADFQSARYRYHPRSARYRYPPWSARYRYNPSKFNTFRGWK